VDHAGALGHACDAVFGGRGGREGERPRDQLGEGVGCADGAGGGEPVVVGGAEGVVGGGDFGEDFLDRESVVESALMVACRKGAIIPLPDNASAHDYRTSSFSIFRLTKAGIGGCSHLLGVF
jgi:hypothetical protein